MNTVEIYMKVEDTTPISLSAKRETPTAEQTRGLAYWALSFDAYGPYPPVLVHIFCAGSLPPDERRDQINAAIKSYVGELITGQRGQGHIDREAK